MEIILDYLSGSNIITEVLINGRERPKRENQRAGEMRACLTLLALKMEGGAVNQEKLGASRSWEGQGTDSPLERPEQNTALQTS